MRRWILKFASYKKPDDIFDAVVSGKKTIETRPRNPKSRRDYSNIKSGDILVLKSLDSGRAIERIVLFNHTYDSVEEMVDEEDVEKILPGIGSKKSLLKVYEELKSRWGKTYAQKLETYGIVAIGID